MGKFFSSTKLIQLTIISFFSVFSLQLCYAGPFGVLSPRGSGLFGQRSSGQSRSRSYGRTAQQRGFAPSQRNSGCGGSCQYSPSGSQGGSTQSSSTKSSSGWQTHPTAKPAEYRGTGNPKISTQARVSYTATVDGKQQKVSQFTAIKNGHATGYRPEKQGTTTPGKFVEQTTKGNVEVQRQIDWYNGDKYQGSVRSTVTPQQMQTEMTTLGITDKPAAAQQTASAKPLTREQFIDQGSKDRYNTVFDPNGAGACMSDQDIADGKERLGLEFDRQQHETAIDRKTDELIQMGPGTDFHEGMRPAIRQQAETALAQEQRQAATKNREQFIERRTTELVKLQGVEAGMEDTIRPGLKREAISEFAAQSIQLPLSKLNNEIARGKTLTEITVLDFQNGVGANGKPFDRRIGEYRVNPGNGTLYGADPAKVLDRTANGSVKAVARFSDGSTLRLGEVNLQSLVNGIDGTPFDSL